jgi:SPOR domain
MSLTSEMQRAGEPTSDGLSSGEACAHCGSPLRADQEWCLECGAGRTLIHRPPDWRIAAIVIVSVVGLALVAFAIALVNLSSSADRVASTSASAQTSTASARPTAAAATAATPTPPPTPTPAGTASASGKIGSWPVGLSGWTVALASSRSQTAANAAAARFAAAGLNVGVLDSSQHPSMKPGEWVVFSGRYPGRAQAEAAATTVQAKVSGTPVARRVAPPGGL